MPSQEYNEMDTDNKDSMASKSIATNDIFVIDTFPPSGRDAHMSGRRRSSQVSRDSPFMDRNHNNRASTRSNQSVKSSKMHISLTRVPSLSLQEIKKVSPDSLPKPIVEEIEETKSHSGIFGDHTFTRQEICTISSLALGNLCLGTLYALLAPFFPHEVSFVKHHSTNCDFNSALIRKFQNSGGEERSFTHTLWSRLWYL
jgi:hypothetical protein